jgi:hypothetical protein
MDSQIVFIVQHLHVHEGGEEDIKLIGAYSSEATAKQAIERLKLQPGFCEVPEGFTIGPYRLDEDNWAEGYVTMHGSGVSETE